MRFSFLTMSILKSYNMSGFQNAVIEKMERSTAGSGETARRVLQMCKGVELKNALFFGDDILTPRLIAEETGARVLATFGEDSRTKAALSAGLNARTVGAYELLKTDGGWNFVWYNGVTEPIGISERAGELRSVLAAGGTAVFRTLCWLIDPSPDTKSYVCKRFGRVVPLDEAVRMIKESGAKIGDFYIAPKSDWKANYYEPMSEIVCELEGASEDDTMGIGEINKEIYMFNLHSEEYSFVYFKINR